MKPLTAGEINVELIWFDSMGAKSSSILIKTPDVRILVDPGTAEMQPSYPLPAQEKKRLREEALDAIRKAAQAADFIFISHYHYDHHTLPQEASEIYEDKTLWIKDPNLWINRSQWERARLFLSQLLKFRGESLEESLKSPEKIELEDPLTSLPLASKKDFGEYQERKEELLEKGRSWLKGLFSLWKENLWVSSFSLKENGIFFMDGSELEIGATKIRFSPPLFHGVEYDRVGWVISLTLEHKGKKVLYTSDLQGPIIEDYAIWIAEENPDILILDGPATYLLGYMLNQINLRRVTHNMNFILKNIGPQTIIYDHHLLRDVRYKERLNEIYRDAEEEGKNLLTAAEWFGEEPLGLKIHNQLKM